MTASIPLYALVAWSALALAPEKPTEIANDFSKDLAAPWSASKTWKVEKGVLAGEGSGTLDYQEKIRGDFTLTFEASCTGKANVEVKLLDAAGKNELYTFAFLGRYHQVLDGVKSCILEGDRFVKVDPRMWIYPGRTFAFEIRRARNQMQMFLDGELGPAFVDEDGPALDEFRFRIVVTPEGKKDAIQLDAVRLILRK